MKHVIMGVLPNEDFASFEKELSLSTQELMEIMGWSQPEDCVFDYPLTEEQTLKIEKACALKLPNHLDLFLSSHE
ncbi:MULTISPECIES: pyocin S6 family toxin immunity protein [unclassified Pseudomonas]|uniref:pyocin S6 family toxin immunity protein n=1 Tax=unclassified Pseudomonas TaxID=196821 RepID=UPI0021C7FB17|nr:pyocin S6 family toxin immunity protein [Pseudomonas sp. 14P_5.3_Bac1]MCU1779941.1 pyocin S6 family toxin immunity protein [Pseudomonas sp. 14P_5.3_Bac1]